LAGSKDGCGNSVGRIGSILRKGVIASLTTALEDFRPSLKKTSTIFLISRLQPEQARRRNISDRVVARHNEPATTQKGYGAPVEGESQDNT
jgi:hypothetical protein